MHCDDVIRELSAPTGALAPEALADHLAGCPGCASWSRRDARLDRLWEATRPPEPSAVAWDRMWANVSEALDRRAAARPVSVPAPAPAPAMVVVRGRWHRSGLVAFAVAQAAVILIGFGLVLGMRPAADGRRPTIAEPPAPLVFDQGQVPLISLDGQGVHVRDLARNDNPDAIDPYYSMFNQVESLVVVQ